MEDEVLGEIAALVRAGFYSEDRMLEIVCEELYEPGDIDEGDARQAIRRAQGELRAEQEHWLPDTDCDRLDRAFAALAAAGVIALQNAGNTQSDGYEEVREAFDRLREGSGDASSVVGYCFFHGQDLRRAIEGEGLYLAFGPIDPKQESTVGPEVGKRVVAALAKEGLAAVWNGSFESRILLPTFEWRKRGG